MASARSSKERNPGENQQRKYTGPPKLIWTVIDQGPNDGLTVKIARTNKKLNLELHPQDETSVPRQARNNNGAEMKQPFQSETSVACNARTKMELKIKQPLPCGETTSAPSRPRFEKKLNKIIKKSWITSGANTLEPPSQPDKMRSASPNNVVGTKDNQNVVNRSVSPNNLVIPIQKLPLIRCSKTPNKASGAINNQHVIMRSASPNNVLGPTYNQPVTMRSASPNKALGTNEKQLAISRSASPNQVLVPIENQPYIRRSASPNPFLGTSRHKLTGTQPQIVITTLPQQPRSTSSPRVITLRRVASPIGVPTTTIHHVPRNGGATVTPTTPGVATVCRVVRSPSTSKNNAVPPRLSDVNEEQSDTQRSLDNVPSTATQALGVSIQSLPIGTAASTGNAINPVQSRFITAPPQCTISPTFPCFTQFQNSFNAPVGNLNIDSHSLHQFEDIAKLIPPIVIAPMTVPIDAPPASNSLNRDSATTDEVRMLYERLLLLKDTGRRNHLMQFYNHHSKSIYNLKNQVLQMHAHFDEVFVRMVKDYFDFQHRVLVTRLEHQRQQLIHDELLQSGVVNRDAPIQAASSNGNAPVQPNSAPIQNNGCSNGVSQHLETQQGIIRERSLSPMPKGDLETGVYVSNVPTTSNVHAAAALAVSNISNKEPSQVIQGDELNKPTQSKSNPLISYQYGKRPISKQQNPSSVAQSANTSKEATKNNDKSAKKRGPKKRTRNYIDDALNNLFTVPEQTLKEATKNSENAASKRGPKKRKRNDIDDILATNDNQDENTSSKLWADNLFTVPSRNKRRLVDSTGDGSTAVCELDMRK